MGEYADEYFRAEVMREHGIDPGSMYEDSPEYKRRPTSCPNCGRVFKTGVACAQHMRDTGHRKERRT